MQTQWRRLSLYAAVALTILAILFPPFAIATPLGASVVQYGFILTGPPAVSQYASTMSAIGGAQGASIARDMVHYSLDFVRLLFELAAIWAIFLALGRTVLRPAV